MKNTAYISLRTNHLLDSFSEYKFSHKGIRTTLKYVIKDETYGIDIEISSDNSFRDIWKCFQTIHELLFINYGYFLYIKEYIENNETIDYSVKYNNLDFLDSYSSQFDFGGITSIPDLLNSKNINNYNKLKSKFSNGFYSLFYLNCVNYSKILIDHKFCILSQICEGFVESTNIEQIVKKSKKGKIGFKDRLTYYIERLNYYNNKYHVNLYYVLRIKRKTLLNQIEASRHALSHYILIKDKNGNNRSKLSPNNYLFTYIILDLMLRIVIFEELLIVVDENSIKETLYIYHDYIYSNTFKDNFDINNYKSGLYKLHFIEEVINGSKNK